jgi:dihydrofolate synthase/folylpolyglutamate synthase
MTAYAHALRRLEGRIVAGIRPGLETTRLLLSRLGHPDRAYQVVQVAGTNGKGSTCRFLHRICQASGKRTGLFTSPHLLSVRERLVMDEEAITEAEFVSLCDVVLPIAEELQATYFETLTAMGALWFRDRGAEIAVIETGLGGRLDSTTALHASLCGVAQIGLDHTQILGDTIEKIWAEKIAILRHGGTLLTLEDREPLRESLRELARERGGHAVFLDPSEALPFEGIPEGAHQERNLALARALAHLALGRILSKAEVETALRGMVWPGRFQRIAGDPEVILDVGHNPDAAKLLAGMVASPPPVLLFGAMRDKDWPQVLGLLGPACRSVHLAPLEPQRAATPSELQTACPQALVHPTFEEAWSEACREAREAGVAVLAAGSFHLVGNTLRCLIAEGRGGFWPLGITPDPSLPERS